MYISRFFLCFPKMPQKFLKKELDVIILTYFVNIWYMFKKYFLENCNTNKVISTVVYKRNRVWNLFPIIYLFL